MKSILLASASVLAFAGAAAAEVNFSGEAEFQYNRGNTDATVAGYTASAEITAEASQELDNGFTAAVDITAEIDGLGTPANATDLGGSASIKSDTAGITYFFGATGDGQGAAYIGDELDQMSVVDNIFEDEDDIDEDARIEVFGTLAGTTVTVTMNDAEELELGVSSEFAGTTVNLAYDEAAETFAVGASDIEMANASIDVAVANNGTDTFYGLNAEASYGDIELSADIGDAGWEVGADYNITDAISVGVSYNKDEVWTLSAEYESSGVELGMEYSSDDTWEITAGYEMEPFDVDAEYASDETWHIDVSYDMGNGIDLIAGADSGEQAYVAATYDLGSGAEIMVSYAEQDGVDDDPDEDMLDGATIKVSFEF